MRKPRRFGPETHAVKNLLRRHGLHTVCEAARCPNIDECFTSGTATVMILGEVCTRGCRFCNVLEGQPVPPDRGEPARVAELVRHLGLDYLVVTSVTRDDLPDGGAGQFEAVTETVRAIVPGCRIELLVPDFQGDRRALATVLAARPDVLNHNLETIARLYPRVRPRADYRRSLALLAEVAGSGPEIRAKSGIMVGLGEEPEEVETLMADLAATGCRRLTIGQYLQPRRSCLPVARYVEPEEYERYRRCGATLGFEQISAGPFVRSSYQARAGFEGHQAG